jgi:disulfide oxidoreductase YuzD
MPGPDRRQSMSPEGTAGINPTTPHVSPKKFWTGIFAGGTVWRMRDIKWLDKPEGHNYPAARSFLSLIYNDKRADQFVAALRAAPVVQFKSKDIFRAARLRLLDKSNFHVARDRDKIRAGEKLSPLVLVRDSNNGKVLIADGYHRLCAVYSFNEDAVVPCKIV